MVEGWVDGRLMVRQWDGCLLGLVASDHVTTWPPKVICWVLGGQTTEPPDLGLIPMYSRGKLGAWRVWTLENRGSGRSGIWKTGGQKTRVLKVCRSTDLQAVSRAFDVEPGGSRHSASSSSEEPFTCCAVCRPVSPLYCSLHV